MDELLDAGIDVWTTLNVQHVESLNDVVQRITGVRMRETVPDAAFQDAHEIVLVDLPPDELLKRLAEGKVYVQDTATRAVQSFFKPSNLLALRELALRRVAARIHSDLAARMQGCAIEGPWAAGERIMVCVGPDGSAMRVVREAKRLADLTGGSWFAVSVEQPGRTIDTEGRRRVAEAVRLAESLGGEVRQLVAADLAGELLRFARFQNVTQIVIGQARAGRFRALFGRTLADALVKSGNGIAVHVLTSAIVGRAREQADAAIVRMRTTRRLYEFTRKLSTLADEQAMAAGAAAEIGAMLDRSVVILRDGQDGLAHRRALGVRA